MDGDLRSSLIVSPKTYFIPNTLAEFGVNHQLTHLHVLKVHPKPQAVKQSSNLTFCSRFPQPRSCWERLESALGAITLSQVRLATRPSPACPESPFSKQPNVAKWAGMCVCKPVTGVPPGGSTGKRNSCSSASIRILDVVFLFSFSQVAFILLHVLARYLIVLFVCFFFKNIFTLIFARCVHAFFCNDLFRVWSLR